MTDKTLKQIYQTVDSDRGITASMSESETALALEIIVDEIQGLIEDECAHLFDETGKLK